MEARKQSFRSLNEALETLEEAAQSSRRDLERSIGNQYANLKDVFLSLKPDVKSYLAGVGGQASRTLRKTSQNTSEFAMHNAKKVDQTVHERPWMFIGGAAILGSAMAFLFSRR